MTRRMLGFQQSRNHIREDVGSTSNRLNIESRAAIAILAVDNIHVDEDDRNRLRRLDSGQLTHEEALREVDQYARNLTAHSRPR